MGVRGLKTLIENNDQLLERHRLHDTFVVIDGYNLMYSLYWRSSCQSRDYVYGGDFSRYATTVSHFFEVLRKCNVRAVVVLDGGIDPSQIKIKTMFDRLRQRLKDAKSISKDNTSAEKVLPALAVMVFMCVMCRLDVLHTKSTYEADAYIAAIANHLKCPVMSNDSDFFIYDLKSGLILIDSLDLSLQVIIAKDIDANVLYKYIDCQYYHINQLLLYFPGLQTSILPLFSTLMGNDYVNVGLFHKFFNAIPEVKAVNKHKSKILNAKSEQHIKMINLLSWLKSKTTEEVIEFLIKFLRQDEREKAMQSIKLSINTYDIQDRRSDETLISLSSSNESINNILLSIVKHSDDDLLPKWFIKEFHECLLPSDYMDIIRMKLHVLSPQIEDFALKSSYFCAFDLYKSSYELLRINGGQSNEVVVYDRIDNSLTKSVIKCDVNTSLPALSQLREIDVIERRRIIYKLLNINQEYIENTIELFKESDESYDKIDLNGAIILMIAIKYWIERNDVQIWSEFIYALITNIIFCGYIGSSRRVKYICFDKSIEKTVDKLTKYTSRPLHNCGKIFQPRIVHYFCQFQIVLKTILEIDSLLEFPLESERSLICLNGILLYNLTVELSSRADPILFLSDIFGRQSKANQYFTNILNHSLNAIDCNKYVRCRQVSNRKSHLKSQKIKAKPIKNKRLDNRFSLLQINE